MEEQFDFNEILNQFRNGKKLTKTALEAEIESHIYNELSSQKELKTQKLLTYCSVVKELKDKENISFRGISKLI